MVHEDPWHAGNPYIYTLIEGIRAICSDCEILWGREAFWSDDILTFDIVHFHWPQTFMGNDNHSEEELLWHIEKMKNAGVKIVATCHDLEPHYRQFYDKADSMKIVYSRCDYIFHLGNYSKMLFEKCYPNTTHFLLPHHLYDTVYDQYPSRKESLEYLGLPKNYTYVLCFGTFRAKEERNLVLKLSKQLADKKIIILAPSFMNIWWRSFRLFHKVLIKAYYKFIYRIYCTGSTWCAVSDEELPYYYGAADVVFIHRLKILNSGNAVMPMLFGKVVVGPDCGNVGPLLRRWGYPVFTVSDTSQLGDIVRKAIDMEIKGKGMLNRDAQLREYSTTAIAEKLYSFYKQIIER